MCFTVSFALMLNTDFAIFNNFINSYDRVSISVKENDGRSSALNTFPLRGDLDPAYRLLMLMLMHLMQNCLKSMASVLLIKILSIRRRENLQKEAKLL